MAVISGGDGDSSDRLGKEGVNLVGEVDFEVLRSLYRRGLIYLDVPVYPDDHFQGSSLNPYLDSVCSVHAFTVIFLGYSFCLQYHLRFHTRGFSDLYR